MVEKRSQSFSAFRTMLRSLYFPGIAIVLRWFRFHVSNVLCVNLPSSDSLDSNVMPTLFPTGVDSKQTQSSTNKSTLLDSTLSLTTDTMGAQFTAMHSETKSETIPNLAYRLYGDALLDFDSVVPGVSAMRFSENRSKSRISSEEIEQNDNQEFKSFDSTLTQEAQSTDSPISGALHVETDMSKAKMTKSGKKYQKRSRKSPVHSTKASFRRSDSFMERQISSMPQSELVQLASWVGDGTKLALLIYALDPDLEKEIREILMESNRARRLERATLLIESHFELPGRIGNQNESLRN